MGYFARSYIAKSWSSYTELPSLTLVDMLQIYTNIKYILVLLFSSTLISTIDLGLFELRNTFRLTFVIWFILECYWTMAPLNCPVDFFLCASIQGNTLIFPFDAALQLDMKEILLSSVGSMSESIILGFFEAAQSFSDKAIQIRCYQDADYIPII